MTQTSERWYVVQTHPRAEEKAARHLERQGFSSYLPRYLKRRRHARKVDLVPSPLFPRYLFVAVDLAARRWRAIRSTFGVAQLVCQGDDPVPVPDSVIDALKGRQDERGLVTLAPFPRFVRGDRVRVIDGIFSECFGLYEGMTDGERIAVLLDLLGRKVRVVMDMEAVAAA